MPDGNDAFIQTLPEAMRTNEAFKDVKDVGDLATRYVGAMTPKPFADTLPEDIKTDAVFKDIKDLAGLAKGYHSAQKMIGIPKDRLLALPADDKPESMDPIFNRLGRPEKPDGYKFDGVTLPDGMKTDDPQLKAFRDKAHSLGISEKQATGLFGWALETASGTRKAADEWAKGETDKAGVALKTAFGDAYDSKFADAQAAIVYLDKTLGLKGEFIKDLEATQLGNRLGMAQVLAHLGGQLREDGLIGKSDGAGDGTPSPTEAKQQISALRLDPGFKARYLNKSAEGHKEAVAQMEALHKLAYPAAADAA